MKWLMSKWTMSVIYLRSSEQEMVSHCVGCWLWKGDCLGKRPDPDGLKNWTEHFWNSDTHACVALPLLAVTLLESATGCWRRIVIRLPRATCWSVLGQDTEAQFANWCVHRRMNVWENVGCSVKAVSGQLDYRSAIEVQSIYHYLPSNMVYFIEK